VAVIHQEIDSVFLGSDGIRPVFGYALQDMRAFDVEFVAAGRPLVGANLASTITLDSSVSPLIALNTSGVTALLGTTP